MNDLEKMQSWSIIIFFYNEERNIEKTCRQAMDFLSPLRDDEKEIIFVDDGSTDKSNKQIQQITNNKSYIKFINHAKNQGIGACLKVGYQMAQMENVCAVPGDAEFDINELRAFRNIPEKTVISFFRVRYTGYSVFRKLLTTINKWLNRFLFSFYLKDINWVKVYKKSSLKNLQLKSKSSYIESEIIYRLKNKRCKIIQSPSHYLPRQYGYSKSVTFSSLKSVCQDIIRLCVNKK